MRAIALALGSTLVILLSWVKIAHLCCKILLKKYIIKIKPKHYSKTYKNKKENESNNTVQKNMLISNKEQFNYFDLLLLFYSFYIQSQLCVNSGNQQMNEKQSFELYKETMRRCFYQCLIAKDALVNIENRSCQEWFTRAISKIFARFARV